MKRMLFVISSLLLFGTAVANVVPSVNINTADVNQLITLKGIGSKKAEAIVANRKQAGAFHSIKDLARIKGFGKNFIDRLLKRNPGRVSINKTS